MSRRLLRTPILFLILLALAIPGLPVLAQGDDVLTLIDQIRALPSTFQDNFRLETPAWEVDEDSEDSALYFSRGTYRVEALASDLFVWGVADVWTTDVYLEVDATRVGGPLDNEFGIVFRHEDVENFYTFLISSDGYYRLLKFEEGEWYDLISWAQTDLIALGEDDINRMGVLAEGSQIVLFINDQVVDQFEDDTFTSGTFGLAAGSFEEAGVEIAFDDLSLWDLVLVREDNPDLPLLADVSLPQDVTPEAVVTPEVVETPEPVDVTDAIDALHAGEPTVSDDFRSDDGLWSLESDETATFEIARRKLTINVLESNWMGWSRLIDTPAADLLIETDATFEAGPTTAEYGILFRYQDNANFYFFAVTGEGDYSLWKMVDNEWQDAVVPWAQSELLEAGEGSTNRLGVLAQGPQITLFIADTAVAQVEDDTFLSGEVALAVGTFEEPDAEVSFDNVDLWVIEAGQLPVDTPEPVDVPIETPEPISTFDAEARLSEVRATDPTVTSEFRRDDGTWGLETETGASHFYARRALHILIDTTNWLSWSMHQEISAADFLAEVDVSPVAGPSGTEFGMVVRHEDDDNFYFFTISDNGYYAFFKRLGGEWETLIDWTESDMLNQGAQAVNRIGVLGEGPSIALLVNGSVVDQLEDDSIPVGGIGLAAGTFDESGLEVSFDNFSYWQTDEGG